MDIKSLTFYKKLEIVKTPEILKKSNDAIKFWDRFKTPRISKESLTINHTSICINEPYDYLINFSTRILLINGLNDEVIKTFNNGISHLYGGEFRKDGLLITCGTNDSLVVVFDVKSGHKLREFNGHQKDVRCCFFMNNQINVISCSDDSTCKLWDLSMGTCINTFKGHKDYVRCGSVLEQNENIFVCGLYDHNVYLWDIRMKSEKPIRIFEHKNPIESIKVNMAGNVLYCANGNTVNLWDAYGSTTKELGSFSNHIKTVTKVDIIKNDKKIITSSLDKTTKIHDPLTYEVLQSTKYISSVVTFSKSKNENRIIIGTVSGHLYVYNIEDKFLVDEKIITKKIKKHKLLNIKKTKYKKYTKFEKLLRKFEYKAALEEVFIMGKYQEKIISSVIQEIIRQDALLKAIQNSSIKTINNMLKFISDVLRSSNQISFIIILINTILNVCESNLLIFSTMDINEKVIFEKNLIRMIGVIKKELNVDLIGFQIIGMIDMINMMKI